MCEGVSCDDPMPRATVVTRIMARIGAPVVGGLAYAGGLTRLLRKMLVWIWVSAVLRRVRVGRRGLYTQIVRVGVRSLGVVALVSASIGMILALQMAPPLEDFGQTETVANIIAIAVMRELGPLISAIVLTGFAGASIAAELGRIPCRNKNAPVCWRGTPVGSPHWAYPNVLRYGKTFLVRALGCRNPPATC